MKRFFLYSIPAFICLWIQFVSADSIYTWTDKNGVTHFSDKKPVENVGPIDSIHYKPQTENDLTTPQDIDRGKQNEQKKVGLEEKIKQLKQLADGANQRAEKAQKLATEARAQADAFIKRVGPRLNRKRRNKSKINRLIEQAEAAETQAKEFQNQSLEANKDLEEALKKIEQPGSLGTKEKDS
jgi:predicted transcriptional regulator